MLPRYAVRCAIGLLTPLALFAVASNAPAAVMLYSAELTHQTGEMLNPGGILVPTDLPPTPFPNDDDASAVLGSDAMRVAVDNLEGTYHSEILDRTYGGWDDHGFRVVFDVDAPAPFTYHRLNPNNPNFDLTRVTLAADGQPAQALPQQGDLAGVLPAGHYTFTGTPSAKDYVYPGYYNGGTVALGSIRLAVFPEPAALAALGAAPLLLARRRRRH
jgi:hypothetical protein